MGKTVALLKGVNVGGNNLLPMAKLRAYLESLGFQNVKTLLQSGNVVFEESGHSIEELEILLARETEKRFGLRIEYFVRSADQWSKLILGNPFLQEARTDPGHLIAMLTKGKMEANGELKLRGVHKGPEQIHFDSGGIYITYPAGQGTSKLTGNVLERNLGVLCTGRNWNTVLKLGALLGP